MVRVKESPRDEEFSIKGRATIYLPCPEDGTILSEPTIYEKIATPNMSSIWLAKWKFGSANDLLAKEDK